MAFASDISAINASALKAGVIGNLMARVARYRAYRTTLNELAAMSSRELADIGLSRSQIRSVAYEHAYGAQY